MRKSTRLLVRASVRLRREGGSLIMSIPRHIVRYWKLEPGARLVVRSTRDGILLRPLIPVPIIGHRGFEPYSLPPETVDRL